MGHRLNVHDGTGVVVTVPGKGTVMQVGDTVPSDGATGYATGCIFLQTDGGAGTSFYVNEGSSSSADFNATVVASLADDEELTFGTGTDAVIGWETGDASDHSLVIGLGDTSQMLHITDKAAIGTDFNLSSPTHPNVYVHSNTTPATDYLRIGDHDGTEADIDVVGGTSLALKLAGTEYASLRVTGLAVGSYVAAATPGTDQLTLKSTGTAPASTGANVGHLFADFETDDDELFWLSGTNGTSTQLTT